jgi:DNA-binding transcriptional MerR regulator
MPEISISEAAKRAGISRQKLYKNYINKGKISVSENPKGKPCIDTSEILRVFGELKNIDTNLDSKSDIRLQPENRGDSTQFLTLQLEVERLRAENAGLQALSEERKSRIEEQRERIKGLEVRLLEDKRDVKEAPSRHIGFWSRLKSVFAID